MNAVVSGWSTGTPRPGQLRRCGVVDLGSNSVRLVVFEGSGRNPQTIFNEKAVLGLGRGLQTSGLLNPEAIEPALLVLARYYAVATAMQAAPLEVLATAAVRDATNGPAFVAALQQRMPGVPIRILTGVEEAQLSAEGMLLGFPGANGILCDLGGGSLEVVRLAAGQVQDAASLPIGSLRLADRSGGDMARARAVTEEELARLPWLAANAGRDLYLVGGAWRALARIHIAQTGYPLSIVHHYVLRREEARDLAGVVMAASKRSLEKLPGVPQKRLLDLPYAAVVMRRLLRATGAGRVVFSANGLREGWYSRLLPEAVRAVDPMLEAGRELARGWGRDPDLPAALLAWTDPAFPGDNADARKLREAACLVSDIGSHDHPEYRAEQAFWRMLRQHGAGLDHPARAFLALCTALRYEAAPDAAFLGTARILLNSQALARAEALGAALRLAYTLCGGTPVLLAGTALEQRGNLLVLLLREGSGVFAGESVERRLAALATARGLDWAVEAA